VTEGRKVKKVNDRRRKEKERERKGEEEAVEKGGRQQTRRGDSAAARVLPKRGFLHHLTAIRCREFRTGINSETGRKTKGGSAAAGQFRFLKGCRPRERRWVLRVLAGRFWKQPF